MKFRSLVLAAALLVAATPALVRADDALAGALEKVSKDQIEAFNRGDAAATLSYAYTKSPAYDTAKTELPAVFTQGHPKAEQVSFQLIGHDDEFAVARVKVKVTDTAPGFQNNTVDGLMIFHMESGAWKVFDTHVLGSSLVQ